MLDLFSMERTLEPKEMHKVSEGNPAVCFRINYLTNAVYFMAFLFWKMKYQWRESYRHDYYVPGTSLETNQFIYGILFCPLSNHNK